MIEPGDGSGGQRPVLDGRERLVELLQFGNSNHPGMDVAVAEHKACDAAEQGDYRFALDDAQQAKQ